MQLIVRVLLLLQQEHHIFLFTLSSWVNNQFAMKKYSLLFDQNNLSLRKEMMIFEKYQFFVILLLLYNMIINNNKMILLYSIIICLISVIIAQPPLCTSNNLTSCLPCPTNCLNCISSTACSTCEIQYFASVVSGTISCQACSQFCLSCTSASVCTSCHNPFVLVNGTCKQCVVAYASMCSSTVSASSCQAEYYVSNNYCANCLLNCDSCSSNTDCSSCLPGYALNTSYLTCNPCLVGCQICNSSNTKQCLDCYSGYRLNSGSCQQLNCTITNCKYCSPNDNSICQQCMKNYYWDELTKVCIFGSSLVCENGARGPYPTDCYNSVQSACTKYFYSKAINASKVQCIPYSYLKFSTTTQSIKQLYFYSFNDRQQLITFGGSSLNALSYQASIIQYIYRFQSLYWNNLPPYYRINFGFKYITSNQGSLIITANVPQLSDQTQSINISNTNSIQIIQYSTVRVHSDNVKIQQSDLAMNFRLIELIMRFSLCPDTCLRCLNLDLCELCVEPQYMLSYGCVDNCTVYYHFVPTRACLVSCPDKYYHRIVASQDKYCEPCVSPCLTCLDSSRCLSCNTGKYFYNYTCTSSCPDQYFGNIVSKNCEPCISPCKTCQNATTCLSCQQGFWNGTKCSSTCPNGKYGNNLTNLCQNCNSNCATCLNISTFCTSCISSKFLHNSQCLDNCPERYFPITNTSNIKLCSPCQNPCDTCSNQTYCLTCSYDFLSNGTCINSCPALTFPNYITKSCHSCVAPCKQCLSETNCLSCQTGCLLLGSCINQCPSKQWYSETNTTNNQCECKSCVYPCKQCINKISCLSCLTGFLKGDSCLTQCPSGYYGDTVTLSCKICSDTFVNCESCTQKGCLVCSNTTFLFNSLCMNSCPSNFYQLQKKCNKCIAPCLECSSFSICKSCIQPYSLYGGSYCIIQCPVGEISINFVCQKCASPCFACSGTTTNCSYCINGYYLFGNQCVTNCSNVNLAFTYYLELSTSSCVSCMFPCKTCISQTYCLSCNIGYLNNISHTCQSCSSGTYPVPSNSTCASCPTQCSACYSSTICTACKSTYYLYQGQCISDTNICYQAGYYATARTCQPCRSPCSKCLFSSTNCTACLTGYIYFSNNSCLVDCPNGYYQNSNSICQLCSSQCATCITSAKYCLSCNANYFLYLTSMQCLNNCPNGTYVQGQLCQICRYPCLTCSSQAICKSCVVGSLVGDKCYSSCSLGHYSDTKMICQPCETPCQQCSGTATNCTQCISSTYLYNYTCVNNCIAGYFSQSQSLQCLQCIPICKQCSNSINCTACFDDKIYYFQSSTTTSQCVISCPISFYNSTNDQSVYITSSTYVCLKCPNECLTCVNNLKCLLCRDNKVQHQGTCINECPIQMYNNGGVCLNCSTPCYSCTDTETCKSCVDVSYLLVGSAQCVAGPTCPQGYYMQPSGNQCNSFCPDGYYLLDNRTCSANGCGQQRYMGADMKCYAQCPSSYLANKTYHCILCQNNCNGLFWSLDYEIKRDSLFIYLQFTQTPFYLTNSPSISVVPSINYTLINGYLLNNQIGRRLQNANPGKIILTYQIFPSKSLEQTVFTVTFNNALATFQNPIQHISKNLVIQGYDLYACQNSMDTILSILGICFLIGALIGLVKNPLITDFSQGVFILAILSVHYPCFFSYFVENTKIAHLGGLFGITQNYDIGQKKFEYVVTMGFLTNAFHCIIIIVIGLIIALILYLVLLCLRRKLRYGEIVPTQNQNKKQGIEQNLHADQQIQSNKFDESKQSLSQKLMNFLGELFDKFQIHWLNRFVYFTYSYLAIFTIAQFFVLKFEGIDAVAFIAAIFSALFIAVYPLTLISSEPKFLFLYYRKFFICIMAVLSINYPIYIVGMISVCNLSAATLLMAFKLQKWIVETWFMAIGEILQMFAMILLAIFILIGEGYQTNIKTILIKIIIAILVIILVYYLLFSIFQAILFIIFKVTGVDYKSKWAQSAQKQNTDSKDSQSYSDNSMKENMSKKHQNQDPKTQPFITTAQGFFRNNFDKELEEQPVGTQENNNRRTGQYFWTYNQKQSDHNQPPQMLIRCVNQFSDYNQSENHGN